MATYGAAPDEGGLGALLDGSPDPRVRTSAAAEIGFLAGLVGVLSAPFSVMHAVTFVAGGIGLLLALVGVVATSRPYVAGKAIAPLGLLFAFVTLVLVGMRYAGVDTAFGDALVPAIVDWLERLNSVVPTP